MMINNKTVVIPCAGMGKRLGMNIPKALLEIDGKTLIRRNLELLDECSDIRIVVGFKADEVIKEVLSYRRDVTFVFNHDYEHNGTGASVSLAAKYSNEFVITIDGDLLIHPEDIKKILNEEEEFVGVCTASTDNPVLTQVDDNKVIAFSREKGEFEWTGISQFLSKTTDVGNGHVYQLLEPKLPLKYIFLRTKEIDTPNDYNEAIKWLNKQNSIFNGDMK